jgi:hypothetical protein
MSNFVQATKYDVYMSAKFACLDVYRFFVINYLKFWFTEIFYHAVMHKNGFGHAYCQDLVKMILKKFISYFSDIYTIYYNFLKFIRISII